MARIASARKGADPFHAFIAGNPPKKIVKRVPRGADRAFRPVVFLAHCDMNDSTDETRKRFLEKVKKEMERF